MLNSEGKRRKSIFQKLPFCPVFSHATEFFVAQTRKKLPFCPVFCNILFCSNIQRNQKKAQTEVWAAMKSHAHRVSGSLPFATKIYKDSSRTKSKRGIK